MDYSAAIFTSIGFLCIMTLGFACRYLVRICRREQATPSTNKQPGSADSAFKEAQGPATTPQLCAYKKRFLASMPSLDRFLCNTLSWHEGVTLESGLGNLSTRQGLDKTDAAPGKQPGDRDASREGINNNNNDDAHKMENGRTDGTSQGGGNTTASPRSSSMQDNNTRNPAHSILNLVSAIPNITLGSICHTQSLPNVNGCLAESVSTSTISRDLLVLWSTTLESVNSGVLSSTHVE